MNDYVYWWSVLGVFNFVGWGEFFERGGVMSEGFVISYQAYVCLFTPSACVTQSIHNTLVGSDTQTVP
jgi:hypothetical protein